MAGSLLVQMRYSLSFLKGVITVDSYRELEWLYRGLYTKGFRVEGLRDYEKIGVINGEYEDLGYGSFVARSLGGMQRPKDRPHKRKFHAQARMGRL